MLLSLNNTLLFAYTLYSIRYVANATRTIITFAFRQYPSFWSLDDVSVIDTTSRAELMRNGGFENGTLDSFIYCDSAGFNSTYYFPLGTSHVHTGLYSFEDGSLYDPDYLSQVLNTSAGRAYNVTFWLQNGGGPPNAFLLIMSH